MVFVSIPSGTEQTRYTLTHSTNYKLLRLDRMGGHLGDSDGSSVRSLCAFDKVQGWVAGKFGEVSPDLHKLLDLFARKGTDVNHAVMGVDTPFKVRSIVKLSRGDVVEN